MGLARQWQRMAGVVGSAAFLLGSAAATQGAEAIRRVVREQGARTAVLEYVLPAPALTVVKAPTGDAFVRLKVEGAGPSAAVGQPELPTLVDDIEVAPRGEITVVIAVGEAKTMATAHWVYPAQESVPKLPGALERRAFAFDKVWYGTARKAHAQSAGVPFTTRTYNVRGRRYVRVSAAPYVYDPVSKELSFPATVRLAVSVGEAALPAAAGPRLGAVRILRVPLDSRATLDDLQVRGLDIKTVRGADAIVYATAAEHAALLAAGYAVEVLATQTPDGSGTKAISAGYHDWAQVQSLLAAFAAAYPTLCRLETIGTSTNGRPLLALRITDQPDTEEAEPEVKFVGAIHGDEVIGTEMCLRFIDYLLSGYATDSRIRTLVDNTDIAIVPVMNPDGHVANSRYNAAGIDLNRSFPDGAETTIGTVFTGPAMDTAGRPAETIAMMQWAAARHFVLSGTFHTGALVANYPYDNDGLGSVYSPSPDQDVYVWLAETYSAQNAPMWASSLFAHGVTNGAAWYEVLGGIQDWQYRYLGCMDLTLEISSSDRPAASALPGLWDDNRAAMMAYLETVHTGLRGVVSAAADGAPLYATVAVQDRAAPVYSDADLGDYYRLLRPGTYTVTFSAPGYQPKTVSGVVVSAAAPTQLDVALETAGATGGVPLIVVHHADHDGAYAAYRDQKAAEGYAVTPIRLTGTPTAESVRTLVRAAYTTTLAKYLVILGDIEAVPTFTNTAYGATARSDLAYALLDPGETFDDYLGKDLAVGRIALDTNAELLQYVAKLAAFTRGPRHRDLTWVSGGSTTSENDTAEGTHNYVMANYIDPDEYHHELFYRSTGTAATLSAHINAGTDAVVYSGHGSETGWLRYDYSNASLSALTNVLDVPIVIGHCCLTGSFQLDECFAEAWLATSARAVAYLGGSQNTLWDEDDVMQRREFQWLSEHPGGTLADALDYGLRQTAAAYPTTAEYYFTIYHVFGDPTVRLFGLPVDIDHVPLADTTNRAGPYVVEATVTSEAAIAAVTLYWRTAGATLFTAVPMTAARGTVYRATIPGQPYGSQVEYYLQAVDSSGTTALSPTAGATAPYRFAVGIAFAHTPLGDSASTAGPYRVEAVVSADGPLTTTLYWRTAAGAFSTLPMVAAGGGAIAAAIPGQPSGTLVSYYLRAQTSGGDLAVDPAGAPTAVYSFHVDAAAPVFAGLGDLAATDGRVTLAWSAATDALAVTYRIYRSAEAGDELPTTLLATTAALTYVDTTVTNGVTYSYLVRAVDAAGNAEANTVVAMATPEGPKVIHSWTLDTDPGWAREGAWAYGTPLGQGGAEHGSPDPATAATGTAVFGFNLAGDYTNSMQVRYLTTGAIDCGSVLGTLLRFQRWLNVEQPPYDHATVEVSVDGAAWTVVWQNTAEVADSDWTQQTIDLSAWADGCETVYLRWGMGSTDSSWTYSGWNLDDIQIVQAASVSDGFMRAYWWPLDLHPGWSADKPWAFGVPKGKGGRQGGFADPKAGFSGTTVLGYNLAGDYGNKLKPRYLTTAAIDCSALTDTHLRFRRWLNVERFPNDRAAVEVSCDGLAWTTVWQNDELVLDSSWQAQSLDVSTFADGCATFRVRWVMGLTNRTLKFSGWNLDDVSIWGSPATPAKGTARVASRAVTATSASTAAGWLWPIAVSGSQPVALAFGVDPAGAWHTPAPAAAAAWWVSAEGPSARLVQAADAAVAEWLLAVAPGATERCLTWVEPAGVPAGQLVSLVEVDAEGAPLAGGLYADLRQDVGLVLPAATTPRQFLVRYAPEIPFEVVLNAGWNAVALPIVPAWPTTPLAALAGGEAGPIRVAWRYDAGSRSFTAVGSLRALEGYWVKTAAPARLVLRGTALTEPALVLAQGWNLVGVPCHLAVPPGAAQGVGPWLAWDAALGAWLPAVELWPGDAYWVYAPTSLKLLLEDCP